MEIVFLGTSGSVPTPDRSLPALALRIGGELLLWDCGEGTQRELMRTRLGFGSLDAIFITHGHLDHTLGIYGLLETLSMSPHQKPLRLFSSPHVRIAKKHAFVAQEVVTNKMKYESREFNVTAFKTDHTDDSHGFVLTEHDRVKFYEEKAHNLGLQGVLFSEIQKKGKVSVGGKTIRLSDVTYKQKGRKVVYTGDTKKTSSVVKAAKEADVLIHEATFCHEHRTEAHEHFHSTAQEAAEVAKKAKVGQLILTHISPRYSKDVSRVLAEARAVFPNTHVAFDGMRVNVQKK